MDSPSGWPERENPYLFELKEDKKNLKASSRRAKKLWQPGVA